MIVRLKGRMGHQMLTYATARTFTNDITINISDFKKLYYDYALDKFNIIGQVLPTELDVRGVSSWKVDGFNMIRDILIKEFSLKEKLQEDHKLIKKIRESNSVAIHIRRGDYVGTYKKQRDGICTLDYYYNAMVIMEQHISNINYFIFSDDIEWCKENFKEENNYNYIEGNPPHIDLELMKNCKHFIIANSSFSWWGAWLSENKDKLVIMPKRWMNNDIIKSEDMQQEGWIMI